MITPLSLLERVPTYKDQQEQLKEKDLATYGFLGYPLLQSADILIYQASFVPVGQDQAAHVELTREIARRFNQFFPGEFVLSPDAAPWEMEAIKEKARKLAATRRRPSFRPTSFTRLHCRRRSCRDSAAARCCPNHSSADAFAPSCREPMAARCPRAIATRF